MGKRVVIGLSGGVDSSVAAYILKKQGYEVIALFMINWHDHTGTLTGQCTWEDDSLIAKMVAKKLDIPFHIVDLSRDYKKRVVEYMFKEYEKGNTPNPDVLCNREIKFDSFLKECDKYNADYVATGHYCRVDSIKNEDDSETFRLLAGTDSNKDQSYFLCQLNQHQLSKSMFPIGNLIKPEVRRIAAELNLPTATRKDSQGICFVGKVDLPVFLQQKLKSIKGNVIEISSSFMEKKKHIEKIPENFKKLCFAYPLKPWNGKIIGEHQGAQFYTIGQRKGLNIGGHKHPLFVLETDVKRNIIYVGEGENHPGLYRPGLFIAQENIHWIRPDLRMSVGETRNYLVRIRYRQPLESAKLYQKEEGIYILFDREQRGVTPGQFAAWYDNDEVIGSGTIEAKPPII